MRPVSKCNADTSTGRYDSYSPYQKAKADLVDNLGDYCSYCEVFSPDLEVEHVISKSQAPSLENSWGNFLLACGRCNGKANKSNKHVDFMLQHFPHKNNTMLSFRYLDGGAVVINDKLPPASQKKAAGLMELVGLDKYPGNPNGKVVSPSDKLWRHRKTIWEYAVRFLDDYKNNTKTENDLIEFALQRGFFSVWFTVFREYPKVLEALIAGFRGTDKDCFDRDSGFAPKVRNPNDPLDPV